MATISVIIVSYNAQALLADALESLAQQTRPADEIIVVDNGSSDGSADYVETAFPNVRLIRSSANLGFTGGNNLGLRHTSGDYIALLNADTVVDKDWLLVLERALSADGHLAAVDSRIMVAGAEGIVDCAGAEFNNAGHCWGRGYGQRDTGQFGEPREVAGVTACAALLRRDAFLGEPLFDEDFFIYYEEMDLTLRLRGRGYGIGYAPDAIVYHKGSMTVNRLSPNALVFKQALANRNRLKILAKYYPARLLARNLLIVALSVGYWDSFFLVKAGPRFLLRALVEQGAFVVKGLRERRHQSDVKAERWLPWMTQQKAIEMYRLRSR